MREEDKRSGGKNDPHLKSYSPRLARRSSPRKTKTKSRKEKREETGRRTDSSDVEQTTRTNKRSAKRKHDGEDRQAGLNRAL